MQASALDQLQERAAAGDVAAQIALARHHEAEGRYDEARHWLERGVKVDSAEAMAVLAELFLLRPNMPVIEGVKLAIAAAERGNARGAHQVAVFSAVGAGIPQNWTVAVDFLQRSAEFGWPLARAQLALFCSDRILAQSIGQGQAPDIWKRLRDAIDIPAMVAITTPHQVKQSPRISVAENFLPNPMCDWLVERARPKMERARVFSKQTGGPDVNDARSNSFTDFNIVETDLVIALVRARVSAATGLSTAGMEQTAILHYATGQEFSRHYDFLDTDNPAYSHDLERFGQRAATFLLYLNEGYDAGETDFPLIDWKYKGRCSDAMFFFNVDAIGNPDRQTLHAGLAPRRGEKWLLSQFIRTPYAVEKH